MQQTLFCNKQITKRSIDRNAHHIISKTPSRSGDAGFAAGFDLEVHFRRDPPAALPTHGSTFYVHNTHESLGNSPTNIGAGRKEMLRMMKTKSHNWQRRRTVLSVVLYPRRDWSSLLFSSLLPTYYIYTFNIFAKYYLLNISSELRNAHFQPIFLLKIKFQIISLTQCKYL